MEKTRLSAADVEKLVRASGLTATPQKGFLRVDGQPGNRVYIALTKTVARVDLSGFEMRQPDGSHSPGYCEPHCGPFGNVKQQLDFSLPAEQVLANLESLLKHLGTLPAVTKEQKPKKERAPKEQVPTWSPETLQQKEARLELIRNARKVAAETESTRLL